MPVTTDGQQLVYPSDNEAGVDNRRLAAEVIYDQELFTFQDAVEHRPVVAGSEQRWRHAPHLGEALVERENPFVGIDNQDAVR